MQNIEKIDEVDWLNYHHLLYFWTVAREGSIARACERLHLTQPTVSTQLQALERSLGERLFDRTGRRLRLTEAGRLVYRYADEIFALGHELRAALQGQSLERPGRLAVGVVDVLPKLVAYRLLEPALRGPEAVRVVCEEGKAEHLLAALATHGLDLVLTDAPMDTDVKVRAFHHRLGECGISIMGTTALARTHGAAFPRSLDGAPFLLPTPGTALRRGLDRWFETERLHPHSQGEFVDSALMKVFGKQGIGLFATPTVIENDVATQYEVEVLGRVPTVRERFYAITVERRVKHPAVAAICETARRSLFA